MVRTRRGTDTVVVAAKRQKYAEFSSAFSSSFHRVPLSALLKHSSVRDRFRWSAVSRAWCEHGSGGWRERLAVGDLVDARDSDCKWYDARVVAIALDPAEADADDDASDDGGSDKPKSPSSSASTTLASPFSGHVRVHFRGWSDRWDCWLPRRSPAIQPLHSHTRDWRWLEVGDIVELNSAADGFRPLWCVPRPPTPFARYRSLLSFSVFHGFWLVASSGGCCCCPCGRFEAEVTRVVEEPKQLTSHSSGAAPSGDTAATASNADGPSEGSAAADVVAPDESSAVAARDNARASARAGTAGAVAVAGVGVGGATGDGEGRLVEVRATRNSLIGPRWLDARATEKLCHLGTHITVPLLACEVCARDHAATDLRATPTPTRRAGWTDAPSSSTRGCDRESVRGDRSMRRQTFHPPAPAPASSRLFKIACMLGTRMKRSMTHALLPHASSRHPPVPRIVSQGGRYRVVNPSGVKVRATPDLGLCDELSILPPGREVRVRDTLYCCFQRDFVPSSAVPRLLPYPPLIHCTRSPCASPPFLVTRVRASLMLWLSLALVWRSSGCRA